MKEQPSCNWKANWSRRGFLKAAVAAWATVQVVPYRVFGANSNRAVYHPCNFRGWWDFGTGALGDMGGHHFNTPFRAQTSVSAGNGGHPLPPEGTLDVGDQGTMLGHVILNGERERKFKDTPRTLPRRGGTWSEWMEAVQGGERAGCSFEWDGMLAEAVQLGNIAIRCGKRLAWDTGRREFTNDPEANGYVQEPCHNGWTLETV